MIECGKIDPLIFRIFFSLCLQNFLSQAKNTQKFVRVHFVASTQWMFTWLGHSPLAARKRYKKETINMFDRHQLVNGHCYLLNMRVNVDAGRCFLERDPPASRSLLFPDPPTLIKSNALAVLSCSVSLTSFVALRCSNIAALLLETSAAAARR